MEAIQVRAATAAGESARDQGPATGFETAAQAVARLEALHGKSSSRWAYFDAGGDPAGMVVRWDGPQGKTIRPVHKRADGLWDIGGMPEPRPLYELPSLLARPEETVYVTEGEKAADAAGWLGLLATTSPHGSGSAGKADWRPLAGRDVVILPDNDEPGRAYARTVVSILHALQPPARVRIVELPGLATKGDMYDWVESGPSVVALRGTLKGLVDAAKECPRSGGTSEAGTSGGGPVTSAVPVLQCFADVVPTSVRWLWPGRVPLGRITLLVGRPGEGKSFLTTDLAARVSTGRPWPDGTESVEGSVIFICAEDDPADTLRPRLDAHGADVRRIHLLERIRRVAPDGRPYDAAFTLADVQALEGCLQLHRDCRMIVVDPIGSYLGCGTDSYRDNDVRGLLDPVAHLADLYGPAVLVVAHRRKDAATTHADDLALGSRAFTGVA
ncbi:MAG: AAA family ATPase, partial [Solirubrobacterales bacterium]